MRFMTKKGKYFKKKTRQSQITI